MTCHLNKVLPGISVIFNGFLSNIFKVLASCRSRALASGYLYMLFTPASKLSSCTFAPSKCLFSVILDMVNYLISHAGPLGGTSK